MSLVHYGEVAFRVSKQVQKKETKLRDVCRSASPKLDHDPGAFACYSVDYSTKASTFFPYSPSSTAASASPFRRFGREQRSTDTAFSAASRTFTNNHSTSSFKPNFSVNKSLASTDGFLGLKGSRSESNLFKSQKSLELSRSTSKTDPKRKPRKLEPFKKKPMLTMPQMIQKMKAEHKFAELGQGQRKRWDTHEDVVLNNPEIFDNIRDGARSVNAKMELLMTDLADTLQEKLLKNGATSVKNDRRQAALTSDDDMQALAQMFNEQDYGSYETTLDSEDDVARLRKAEQAASITRKTRKQRAKQAKEDPWVLDVKQRTEDIDLLRYYLIQSQGSVWDAYRYLDIYETNILRAAELVHFIEKAGIGWKDILETKDVRQVYRLWSREEDPEFPINLRTMFPVEADLMAKTRRTATPDFWKRWVRKNLDLSTAARTPVWKDNGPDKQLNMLLESIQRRQQVQDRRKWMEETCFRLKARGKTSNAIRTIICRHLPRGTGVRDSEGISSFSDQDLKAVKRSYYDAMQKPLKSIQKVVYDLRGQRQVLMKSRKQLYNITDKILKAKEEEDRIKGLALDMGKCGLGKARKTAMIQKEFVPPKIEMTEQEKKMSHLADKLGLNLDEVECLYGEFKKYDKDDSDYIEKREFSILFQDILNMYGDGTRFTEFELDRHWDTMRMAYVDQTLEGENGQSRMEAMEAAVENVSKLRKDSISFGGFATWFVLNYMGMGDDTETSQTFDIP